MVVLSERHRVLPEVLVEADQFQGKAQLLDPIRLIVGGFPHTVGIIGAVKEDWSFDRSSLTSPVINSLVGGFERSIILAKKEVIKHDWMAAYGPEDAVLKPTLSL